MRKFAALTLIIQMIYGTSKKGRDKDISKSTPQLGFDTERVQLN